MAEPGEYEQCDSTEATANFPQFDKTVVEGRKTDRQAALFHTIVM